MTQAEQASLDALRTEVQTGFREMRELQENRRLEEVRVQVQYDTRLALVERTSFANKQLIRFLTGGLTTIIACAAIVATIIYH